MKSPQPISVTTGIRSRQHYPCIEALPSAQRYLVVSQAPVPGMAQAAVEQLEQLGQRVRVLLDRRVGAEASVLAALSEVPSDKATGVTGAWLEIPESVLTTQSRDEEAGSRHVLSDAINHVGASGCLIAIGSEHFVWQIAQQGQQRGLVQDDILMLPVAACGRHLFCVHCQHVTANVHHTPATCGGCGMSLEVRDHFSKRLGGYMGVRVDAEAPGELPETQEVAPCLAS
ncbi:dimethylamine monooxygenase subunit DmmA family protein [Cobetia sp. L2A1]|uniref:dimethylamine monooxygenase subunit DmmA family protein n=1 Tax=Cobetia sp. L2A1 TaxID=2686360 RepID=UPI00131D2A68|nr:dimethylamine monooxygenase subunit DmmA family protein [Cobetia sp. L2A1]